jgi:uncharacterized membrane protein
MLRLSGMEMYSVVAMWALGWLVVFAVLAAIGAAIRRRRLTHAQPTLDALGERYARGEITRDELEARRRDLAA